MNSNDNRPRRWVERRAGGLSIGDTQHYDGKMLSWIGSSFHYVCCRFRRHSDARNSARPCTRRVVSARLIPTFVQLLCVPQQRFRSVRCVSGKCLSTIKEDDQFYGLDYRKDGSIFAATGKNHTVNMNSSAKKGGGGKQLQKLTLR